MLTAKVTKAQDLLKISISYQTKSKKIVSIVIFFQKVDDIF